MPQSLGIFDKTSRHNSLRFLVDCNFHKSQSPYKLF